MDSSGSLSILAPSQWGRLARLAQKELRETLRDRRTIGTLVLMPILVYPLLNVAFQRLLLSGAAAGGPIVYHIGVDSQEKEALLRSYLDLGKQFLAKEAAAAKVQETPPDVPSPPAEAEPEYEIRVVPQLEEKVRDLELDLAVRLEPQPPPEGARGGVPIDCQVIFRPNSPASEGALRLVEERLRAVNEGWVAAVMERVKISRWRLADFVRRPIQGADAPGVSLATLAPLILILMTVTGAVYPAIDLTAGERERGTMETLVAAPVPRLGLLLAKYVAVLTVALLTALVNFLAMTLTIIGGGLTTHLFGAAGLSLATVLQVFALTILFAAFFSAVLLAITSFARSFKEAQAYLIPLTLVSLAPGFLAFMPGLELNGALAVAPLVNIVLVARDMFGGEVDPRWLIVAIGSTLAYALAALAAAARIFGADALLFGADEGWSAWLRRPRRPRRVASLGNALVCLAVLLPSYLLLSGALAQFREAPLVARLLGAGVITSLLFGVIPLAAALLGRVSVREGFALGWCSPLGFLGAAVLGLSLWPLAHEIFLLSSRLGLGSLDEEKLQPAMRLMEQLPDLPLWLVLAALAVTPAVFEEFFFRGYLFGAIRTNAGPVQAIALTAVLFSLFHVFSSVLAVERMLPSLFLGLVLGAVRSRTGSVLPGMLLHACHNGFLMAVAHYHEKLAEWGWGLQEQEHLPAAWLAAAAVAVAIGAGLIAISRRIDRRETEKPNSFPAEQST